MDQEQVGHAISLAVTPNLPLGVTRTGELSMWKGCAAASATRAAIFAAQLAEQGMTGPFEPFVGSRGLWGQAVGQPVEIPAFPNLVKAGNKGPEDAETSRITDTTFKYFPAQVHTQAPIGLALDLRAKVDPAETESIRIRAYHAATSSAATEPEKSDPKTRETADHCIPYLVAVAFQDGAVTPASFTSRRISDPALRPIISKISIAEDQEFTRGFPDEFNCHMEVTDRSGHSYVAETSYPRGYRLNALSDSDVEAKFHRLAGEVLTEQQCDLALQLIWSLEDLPDLEELL